ncbi:Pentatricopeptide repeat-containing protein [Rhynchospora pubera]|uniref:Pentatricopeptide repeat-containing protein n=1 Tax=Rhynchospora pubera TaxID=906938 RepID=A0AAV8HHW6_9POAL|nr:Pentatricopeptide repeat-containing protein [Rhynchospora pubera]
MSPFSDPYQLHSLILQCRTIPELTQLHALSIRHGHLPLSLLLTSSLLLSYASLHHLHSSFSLFSQSPLTPISPFLWNSLSRALSSLNFHERALTVYNRMLCFNIRPDERSLSFGLIAAARAKHVRKGQELHASALKFGFLSRVFVGNTLLKFYGSCGLISDVEKVFDEMSKKDIISWNSMVSLSSDSGLFSDSLNWFLKLKRSGFGVNSVSLTSVIPACVSEREEKFGMGIHGLGIKAGLVDVSTVGNALVDMYGSFGHIDALEMGVFDLIREMVRNGEAPDSVSYANLLPACARIASLEKGKELHAMSVRNGRAGLLTEAEELIKGMPFEPNSDVWGALLGACRIYGDIEMARRAAMHLFELEPDNSGYYTVLSNMYAEVGRWEEADEIRMLMKDRKVKKNPGYSWVQRENRICTFVRAG